MTHYWIFRIPLSTIIFLLFSIFLLWYSITKGISLLFVNLLLLLFWYFSFFLLFFLFSFSSLRMLCCLERLFFWICSFFHGLRIRIFILWMLVLIGAVRILLAFFHLVFVLDYPMNFSHSFIKHFLIIGLFMCNLFFIMRLKNLRLIFIQTVTIEFNWKFYRFCFKKWLKNQLVHFNLVGMIFKSRPQNSYLLCNFYQ